MALQNFWGFENGLVPDGFEAKSFSGFPNLAVTSDDPANGNYCISVENLAASPTRISVPVKKNSSELLIGFNFKVSTLEASAEVVCYRVGESYISVLTEPDGALAVTIRPTEWPSNRGRLIGTTDSFAIGPDRWVFLSFHFKAHLSTGIVDIHRNGMQFASFRKIDTGKNSPDRELFVGGKPTMAGERSFVDDLVIADSTGSTFNQMIAPVSIENFEEKKRVSVRAGHRLLAASAIYNNSVKEILTSEKPLTETAVRKLARP